MTEDTLSAAESAIARYVRPLVEADGGRIHVVEVSGLEVTVELSGVCMGCPGRPYTLEYVVERALRHALGPDVRVRAVMPTSR